MLVGARGRCLGKAFQVICNRLLNCEQDTRLLLTVVPLALAALLALSLSSVNRSCSPIKRVLILHTFQFKQYKVPEYACQENI